MERALANIRSKFSTGDDDYNEMNLIEEGLYLGDIFAAKDADRLKNEGITHVVGLLDSFRSYKQYEGIVYLLIEMPDRCDQHILAYIPQVMNFIERGICTGKVLVHCAAGISRSSSMVIAYIMIKKSLSFIDAEDFVRRRRSNISPNEGFKKQLSAINIDEYKQYLV